MENFMKIRLVVVELLCVSKNSSYDQRQMDIFS
jgi:hypothetical protein